MRRIFYFTYKELPVGNNSGVLKTQVFDLLAYISTNAKEKFEIIWFCFLKKSDFNKVNYELNVLVNDASKSNFRIVPINVISSNAVLGYLEILFKMLRLFVIYNPQVVHCRGYITCFLSNILKLFGFKKIKVIFDMRGVYPEEQKMIHHWHNRVFQYDLLKVIEKFNLKMSNAVVCVTDLMAGHVRTICHSIQVFCIPPFVNNKNFHFSPTKRQNLRLTYGIDDSRIVLLFSGSFDNPWAFSPLYKETFNVIYEIYSNPLILVLSNSKRETIELLFQELGIKNEYIKILSPKQAEIADITSIADIGLILREESIVNAVAFPIKFLEYLSSGLPVLTSKANMAISSIVDKESVGIVCDQHDLRLRSKFKGILEQDLKIRCRKVAMKFDICEAGKMYDNLYSILAE